VFCYDNFVSLFLQFHYMLLHESSFHSVSSQIVLLPNAKTDFTTFDIVGTPVRFMTPIIDRSEIFYLFVRPRAFHLRAVSSLSFTNEDFHYFVI